MKRPTVLAATLLPGIFLGGCADLSVNAARIDPVLTAACNDAIGLANIAGLVPGVGAIVPYITAGCATAEGLTRLAADPTSTQWVGQLIGQVKTLASAVGMKLQL